MTAPIAAALLLALAGCLPQAAAEVYRFEDEPVPDGYSLHAKYLFYAWVKEKSEDRLAEFPVMTSSDLRLSGPAPQDYAGVQVSLLPWEDFNKLVDPQAFCVGSDHAGILSLQKYPSKAWVNNVTVPLGKVTSDTRKVFKSGVYVLVLSNCGSGKGLKISGSVSVKNPFGFLPGSEYYRLPLYGWATLFWAGAGILWFALLVVKKDAVVWAHIALAWIIITGFAESVAWWFALSTVNSGGEAPKATSIAEVLSVMRNIYAVTFILVASMGLGVTEADLSRATKTKILAGSTVFGISAVPRVCLSSMRQAVSPKDNVVILANVPVILVSAFIFVWILRRLASNMRRCKELNQSDSLAIFQRLAIVVSICMFSALGAVIAQFLDKPGRGMAYWQAHAFWNDGVGQGIALTSLLATMYFFAPSKSGFLAESYMTQIDDQEETGLKEEPIGKSAYDLDDGGQKGGRKEEDGSFFVVGGEGDPEEGEVGAGGAAQPAASAIGAQSLE